MLRIRFSVLAICITLLLQASLAVAAPYKSWTQLTPVQQEALQPLATQWDSLSTKLQKNLLYAAKRYPKLTPEQKQRFQNRLEKWSKLTPEQRKRAREKFSAFSKVPPERREQVKQMVRQQEEASKTAASGVPLAAPAMSNK